MVNENKKEGMDASNMGGRAGMALAEVLNQKDWGKEEFKRVCVGLSGAK